MSSRLSLWFPLYPKDFLTSFDVQAMTAEQIGGFLLLLMNSWLYEKPCHLPNQVIALQRLTKIPPERWEKSSQIILGKFRETEDGKMIYNPRLLEIWEAQVAKRDKLSAAGKKGMAGRWKVGASKPKAQPKKAAEKPRVNPADHPDVVEILDRWAAKIQPCPTRNAAKFWIARRLSYVSSTKRQTVVRLDKTTLLLAIDNYAEQLQAKPTDCRYAVRNFFNSQHGYCDTYADPAWHPPAANGHDDNRVVDEAGIQLRWEEEERLRKEDFADGK